MATPIGNITDLNTWATSGTSGILTANITLISATVLTLANNSIFDGNGYTITLYSSNTAGLFQASAIGDTIVISNLIVNADGITLGLYNGGLMRRIAHADITLTITNCGVIGTYTTDNDGGGILGAINSSGGYNITISQCFSTVDTNNGDASGSGGIVGETNSTGGGIININNCYTTGAIGRNAGGIAGRYFGRACASGDANIQNCYSVGNHASFGAGGICSSVGYNGGGYATITNCHSVGTLYNTSSASIVDSVLADSTLAMYNCYGADATNLDDSDHSMVEEIKVDATLIQSGNNWGNGTISGWDDTTANATLLNNGTWIKTNGFSSNAGYGLTVFNEYPWKVNTNYSTKSSSATLVVSAGSAETTGISTSNIATIISTTVTNNNTVSDSSTITAISNSIAGTDSEKSSKRRSAMRLLFNNNGSITQFKISAATLNLHTNFTDKTSSSITTMIIVKAGETVNTSLIDPSEAVYSPFSNGESITLFDGTISRVISKLSDQYSLSSDGVLTYNADNSFAPNFNFNNPPTGYFEDDNYLSNNGRITYFGSAEDGAEELGATICFPKGTLVLTDQGEIAIEQITNNNTIDGERVIETVKRLHTDDNLIMIKRDAFSVDVPSRDTLITNGHGILVNNKLIKAKKLINNDTIIRQSRSLYEPIYNILFDDHRTMNVNGMVVETLHPEYNI